MITKSTDPRAAIHSFNGKDRRLLILERLLAIQALDVNSALSQASDLLAEAVQADKIEVFLYGTDGDCLTAVGISRTEMARRQRELGLDKLPISNGGREVEVFRNGDCYISGNADLDTGVLPGFRFGLGIRSMVIVPLNVEDATRGVIQVLASRSEAFSQSDIFFLQAVAGWVGMVLQRAQLAERVAIDAAEKARRLAAEEIVTVLAHDLNNYITPLQTRVDRLSRRAEKENREQDWSDITSLSLVVRRLHDLVEDLLDVERVEHGLLSINRTRIDFGDLVRETAITLGALCTPLKLSTPGEAQLVILADPARIKQVLENLLSNAIRYSPEGLPVDVIVTTALRDNGRWVVLDVHDHGPGIPADFRPRLFTRFGAGRSSSGLGLGLYIARSIAEAHGGSLIYDTSYSEGAGFCLELPLEEAA